MTIYTIGFSKKSLKGFIEALKLAGVSKLIDIRLRNTSLLAGFAKQENLQYVLDLVGIPYEHRIDLAPTDELLDNYKNRKLTWDEYDEIFRGLLVKRSPSPLSVNDNEKICLLCSEPKADKCHRRLVAEYFKGLKPSIDIIHL